MGDWAGFRQLVDNKCLKNQQLTPLFSLSLFQRTYIWVVRDDNSAQKQEVEDQTGRWVIITVSTICH